MVILVSASFKPPTNREAYNESTDPQEHFEGFRATMLLSSTLDAIMCHAFSTTLKKARLRWFIGLPRISFRDFDCWLINSWLILLLPKPTKRLVPPLSISNKEEINP